MKANLKLKVTEEVYLFLFLIILFLHKNVIYTTFKRNKP